MIKRGVNYFTVLKKVGDWVINYDTPFNAANYLKNRAVFVDRYSTPPPDSDSDPIDTDKEIHSISGWWLAVPKLHYYIFNRHHDREVLQRDLDEYDKMVHEARDRVKEEGDLLKDTVDVLKKGRDLLHKDLEKNTLNDRETIILIVHELSRTGAPILGIELAKRIKESANVVVVSLKSGPVVEVLEKLKIPFFILDGRDEYFVDLTIEQIIDYTGATKAVVNSICSYPVIKVLARKRISFVTLVHEFYSSACAPEIYSLIHEKSLSVIYPSELVKADALEGDPNLRNDHVSVMPQGLIRAPSEKSSNDAEERKIKEVFHIGLENNACIVVGMGSIEPRKGVDLFISTAQSILRNDPSTPFRFVWIGHPLTDFHRTDYVVYLKQQIRRAGLSEHVHIMDPVKNLQAAYREADIFFLSSRLDPLPLVSIEAMENGLPLVCFEGASGTADYLMQSTVASATVVPYLDTEAAANKIHDLIIDPVERKRVGSIQKEFARTIFDMDTYTSAILNKFGGA
jgi:glycosyltransferase involved in cell wall biosynthesis